MNSSLSKKFILRKNVDGSNILYNKSTNMLYSITDKLFTFLYIFKDNVIDLNALLSHFETNNISTDDIKAFLSRPDMDNLLVPSSEGQKKIVSARTNIYHTLPEITDFTEYTPERIDFLIIKKCNLRCKHCFENASPLKKRSVLIWMHLKMYFAKWTAFMSKPLKLQGANHFKFNQS